MKEATPFGEPGYFFEAPRWHDGRWWTSDMHGHVVRSFSVDGVGRDELKLDDRPSGLGWMPDGSMLIVSMEKRLLLRLRPGAKEPEVHADLSALTADRKGFCNDMAVDTNGRAYVGFDPDYVAYGMDSDLGQLLCIDPDGSARVVASGLKFPNAIMFDKGRLIVAETMGACLTSFAIQGNDALGPRETWADLSARKTDAVSYLFDGCDIDAESHVWAADCSAGCWRIAAGGAVVDEVPLPEGYTAYACGLGGEDGRTLLICAADRDHSRRRDDAPRGRLFTARVDIAGMRS